MVLVSHASEIIDGDRSRELLTQFSHSISFGEVAVDGFFLVSGYLIAQSVLRSSTIWSYLWKRVIRIVPAYVVAYLAMFALAPLVGGQLAEVNAGKALLRMVLLLPPEVPGAFGSMPHPLLNGSMWTIAYEFRCYLLVLILGLCGLLRRPVPFAIMLAASVLVLLFRPVLPIPSEYAKVVGAVYENARLIPIFLIGTGFYVLRKSVPAYSGSMALIAGLCAIVSLFSGRLADAGVTLFGGYVLLWFAMATKPTWLNQVGRKSDISYGVYLYGWPVQSFLAWALVGMSPLLVFFGSLPIAAGLGWLSWMLVEKPALRFKANSQATAVSDGK